MIRFLLVLGCAGAWLCGAELSAVRSVYVMPMARGLDQYLANRLTTNHVFQVVADPKLADAVFTDRLGEGFLAALEDVSPTPKPAVEEDDEKDKKKDDAGDADKAEPKSDAAAVAKTLPGMKSTFGRGNGTLFLVNAKSREVVWSTFELPAGTNVKQMDRSASDIVSRLMRDLKKK